MCMYSVMYHSSFLLGEKNGRRSGPLTRLSELNEEAGATAETPDLQTHGLHRPHLPRRLTDRRPSEIG